MSDRWDEPDWEILSLVREVRRRVRARGPSLTSPAQEPRWVAALPPAEARLARAMIEAQREMAQRVATPAPPANDQVEIAAPRRRRKTR